MNAYELAEYLDNNVEAMLISEQSHIDNAANMLRQQADRIAELEKQSEPVAWLYAEEYPDSDMEGGHVESFDFNQPSKYQKIIWEKPLYTTPQTKQLSDEEILNIWEKCGDSDISKDMQVNSFIKYFARAIEAKVRGNK